MSMCARARAVFLHVNLLLAVYGGAALATSARLAWDPSAYVALRVLWPRQYYAALTAVPLLAVTLLVAAHLAAAAALLDVVHTRRTLLYAYLGLVTAWLSGSACWVVWAWCAAHEWRESPAGAALDDAADLASQLQPLADALDKWAPKDVSAMVRAIVEEASADLPRNGIVAAVSAGLLMVLLVAAVGLAVYILCAETDEYQSMKLETDKSLQLRPSFNKRPFFFS